MELAGEVRLARFEPSDTCGKVVRVERMEIFRVAYRYSWTKNAHWWYTGSLWRSHNGNPGYIVLSSWLVLPTRNVVFKTLEFGWPTRQFFHGIFVAKLEGGRILLASPG
jgi:hypothetical protein